MRVEGRVIVARPAREVFACLGDPHLGAVWLSGVTEARMIAGAALELGATVQVMGSFLGERLESLATVTGYVPDQALCWRSVSGPVPYRVTVTLDEVLGGVHLTERIEADVRFFRFSDALVRRVAQRQLAHDLATFKDLLESTRQRPEHG